MSHMQQFDQPSDAALRIDRDAVYSDHAIRCILHQLPESLFVTARRTGALRFSRRGRQVFYKGEWVLEWLLSDSESPPQTRGTANRSPADGRSPSNGSWTSEKAS